MDGFRCIAVFNRDTRLARVEAQTWFEAGACLVFSNVSRYGIRPRALPTIDVCGITKRLDEWRCA